MTPKFAVDGALLQSVTNYLSKQPYRKVAGLLVALSRITEIPAEQPLKHKITPMPHVDDGTQDESGQGNGAGAGQPKDVDPARDRRCTSEARRSAR